MSASYVQGIFIRLVILAAIGFAGFLLVGVCVPPTDMDGFLLLIVLFVYGSIALGVGGLIWIVRGVLEERATWRRALRSEGGD